MKPAVFLDRDGVINKVIMKDGLPFSPRELSEFQILEGVCDAIALLQQKGLELVVITNQPDLAKGFISEDLISEMHKIISAKTGIDHFYFCGHDDSEKCLCRKPKVGMLVRAALELKLDLAESFLVGDRWKDIAAGQQVGCDCYFIENNYQELLPIMPYRKVKSLYEAATLISGSIRANHSR